MAKDVRQRGVDRRREWLDAAYNRCRVQAYQIV